MDELPTTQAHSEANRAPQRRSVLGVTNVASIQVFKHHGLTDTAKPRDLATAQQMRGAY
jgi:hypothetical protein